MPLASAVMDEAAALCGDRNRNLYTYDKLLPLLKRAVRDLQDEMLANDLTVLREDTTSATINALATSYPTPPNDLITPIKMWERPDGSASDEDWVPMLEREWDPSEKQQESLEVWKFRDEQILFRGATTARKVKMLYQKSLAGIADQNSNISVINAENYLAAKLAGYGARFIGKNVTLGAELDRDAEKALNLFLTTRIKEDQDDVLRMKPYSSRRRR